MPLSWTTRPRRCRETLQELQNYLDGECDADRAWKVARHLSHCEDCFGDADTFREVKEAVARLRCGPDRAALVRLRAVLATLTEDR